MLSFWRCSCLRAPKYVTITPRLDVSGPRMINSLSAPNVTGTMQVGKILVGAKGHYRVIEQLSREANQFEVFKAELLTANEANFQAKRSANLRRASLISNHFG